MTDHSDDRDAFLPARFTMNPQTAKSTAMRMLAADALETSAHLQRITDPRGRQRGDFIAALMTLSPETFAQLHTALESLRDRLGDVNSGFPATREFLAARGLTHVDQLDADGRNALTAHLERLLRESSKNSAQ